MIEQGKRYTIQEIRDLIQEFYDQMNVYKGMDAAYGIRVVQEFLASIQCNHRIKTMKQIERSKTITYRWCRDGENEIKPEHIEALEERAEERIAEMIGQGYISGELNDNIHMTDDDPEDGVKYTGWWEVSTVNPTLLRKEKQDERR